jgi:hypothetical protein
VDRSPRIVAVFLVALLGIGWSIPAAAQAQAPVKRYVRYSHGNITAYGVLDGETIRELKGDLFAKPVETGRVVKLPDVRLLAPCEPSKVIAVGLNYTSHLGERPAAAYPGLFAKLPTRSSVRMRRLSRPRTRSICTSRESSWSSSASGRRTSAQPTRRSMYSA